MGLGETIVRYRQGQKLDAEVRMGGGGEEEGGSVFGNDYGYLFGPPGIVFPALERFAARILDRCSLHLQRSKTEVFCWGDLPAGTPADLKRAGMEVNGILEPGMECYGIGIGSDAYVNAYLTSIEEDIKEVAEKTCSLLEDDIQAKWTFLTSSISHELSYLQSH